MTDLALLWSRADGAADLALEPGALATDDGLSTAVLISLFTDAEARPDDVLPSGVPGAAGDRRGWWGDQLLPTRANSADDRIGSRLWLLVRSKKTPSVLLAARDYAREALAWLIEDGIATRIDVQTAALPGPAGSADVLAIGATLWRPDGARLRFDHVWEAI